MSSKVRIFLPTIQLQRESEGMRLFGLRPLFLSFLNAEHRRLDIAKTRYAGRIQQYFRNSLLDRDSSNTLLWFCFQPDYKVHRFVLQQKFRGTQIDQPVLVITYQIKGHQFMGFPMLRDYLVMLGEGKLSEEMLLEKAQQHFKPALEQTYDADDELDLNHFLFRGKDVVYDLEVTVTIKSAPFSFAEGDSSLMFNMLRTVENLDGESELETVGENLNELYPEGLRRSFLREAEVEQLQNRLFGDSHLAIAIIGPNGVGKHTLLEEALFRYLAQHQNGHQRQSQVWKVYPNRVIAGMSIVGQWEKRMEAILSYLMDPTGNAPKFPDILMIDEAVSMLYVGKSGSGDMSMNAILKPYLEQHRLRMVVVATPEEWKIVQEKDRRFSDLFEVIRLHPPDWETSISMLLAQRQWLEQRYTVQVPVDSLRELISLGRQPKNQIALPGALTSLLESLAQKHTYQVLTAVTVREAFQQYTGLNEAIFESNIVFRANEIEDRLREQLIGQPNAIEALADGIHLSKAKLTNPDKPIASYLFVGPTGVGKTQAAKVLTSFILGHSKSMIRFDMNEFSDHSAVYRLIGGPGHPRGLLTEKVRQQPFGVLLLDEIEKADRNVHDLLLQVLDDGRLTDAKGVTTDFSQLIIIMTSNLGVKEHGNQLGFGSSQDAVNSVYLRAIQQFFRPEFYNRIDRTVIFQSLSRAHIQQIARLQVEELLKRDGFIRRMTILNLEQSAVDWVADRGYDPKMGGRALKRQIERDLTALTANQLLKASPSEPILLSISLEDSNLKASILPFRFAASHQFKPIKVPADERRRYNQLSRQLERLSDSIQQYRDEYEVDWKFFQFREAADSLLEEVRNFRLSYNDNAILPKYGTLRLKPNELLKTGNGTADNQENLFKRETLLDISRYYQEARPLYEPQHSAYVSHVLKTTLLEHQFDAIEDNNLEHIELHFSSCVSNTGQQEIEFLKKRFSLMLDQMALSYTLHDTFIAANGYALTRMLSSEVGIHLFFSDNENPIPIRCDIFEQGAKSNNQDSMDVLRLYYPSAGIFTDLRTGLCGLLPATTYELLSLIFAL